MSDALDPLQSRHRIVGTAGHIDHGKSTLVRALTGTDPDRLEEEKRRGITIDLGFAHADLPGLRVGFVDVPGHERFVKNMLAGIGGIDAVLLVVAADESAMPQTREHLAICSLLGVRHGVVALSKCDLVDPEIAELVELEVSELLEGTPLAGAPIVRTAATRGEGLDELRAALAELLDGLPERPSGDALRVPVDRVFTMRGFGTVATGTLWAGELHTGMMLAALPSGREASVRGLQVHGLDTERATAGQRVAINLQGLQRDELDRGEVLVVPGSLEARHVLDVAIELLDGHGLEHLQRVRMHHGAAEILGRLALAQGKEVPAGGAALAQLRLESPYPAIPGDRVVLRRYSPVTTIGGAVVLDSQPPKRRRGATALAALERLQSGGDTDRLAVWIDEAGAAGATPAQLQQRLGAIDERLAGALEKLVGTGSVARFETMPPRLLSARYVEGLDARIRDALAAFHAANPLRPGMPAQALQGEVASDLPGFVLESALQRLSAAGELRVVGTEVALGGHTVRIEGDVEAGRDALRAAFDSGGLAPPPPEQLLEQQDDPVLARELFHHELRAAELVRITDAYVVRRPALEQLIADLRGRLEPGERFTVGDFKGWTGLSRRHSIPLLEHLDAQRVTRRDGDARRLV